MFKNHQDIAFFVDPFIFELYEKWERPDVRNLSFMLSVDLFFCLTYEMDSPLLRDSPLRNIALRSLLHNLKLQI